MVSTLSLPIDITEKVVAIITESIDNIPKTNETVKLYIPNVMVNIQLDEPKTHITKSLGSQIFCNDPICKPTTREIIKGQNYIPAFPDGSDGLQSLSNIIDQKNSDYSLKYGDRVICYAPSGKFSNLIFTTGNY